MQSAYAIISLQAFQAESMKGDFSMHTITEYDLLTVLALKDKDLSSLSYVELKKLYEETKKEIINSQPKPRLVHVQGTL